jgi:hypothetical protein
MTCHENYSIVFQRFGISAINLHTTGTCSTEMSPLLHEGQYLVLRSTPYSVYDNETLLYLLLTKAVNGTRYWTNTANVPTGLTGPTGNGTGPFKI